MRDISLVFSGSIMDRYEFNLYSIQDEVAKGSLWFHAATRALCSAMGNVGTTKTSFTGRE